MLRLTIAPDSLRKDLARELLTDITSPPRGVLLAGEANVDAPPDALLQTLLAEAGWGTDEPWTPLRRDLTEPVSDPGVRIEVIGPENADVRSAVQRASFDSSTFTDDRWHAMATGPAYAEACCLVAHDEHDTAVAAVTVWSAGPGNPASSNPPAPTSPPWRRTPRPASSPSWRSATVAGSRSRAERLELRVGQLDRRRGGVRVEVVDARGARDREYDGRPLQQPRERQL